MQIKEWKISTELIDVTGLDEDEVQIAGQLFFTYGPHILQMLVDRGANAAFQMAIGVTLRAAKANLQQGIQLPTAEDIKVVSRGPRS